MFTILNMLNSDVAEAILVYYGLGSKNKDEVDSKTLKEVSDIILDTNVGPLLKEIAIAERINNSEEVEIEEFYNNDWNGMIGGEGEKSSISLGIKGGKEIVTKRIYKFKGINNDVKQLVEHLEKKELEKIE